MNAFTPTKGTLLHHQLFVAIRDQIVRGRFPPGGALPKEVDLCEQFGVSRITVRRALAELAALGLVERKHGLGTFVLGNFLITRPLPSLGLMEELKQQAQQTDVQVLQVEQAAPPEEVATLLKLNAGEPAVHAVRLRSIDKVPVMLTDAWVPASLRKRVTAANLRKMALYEVLLGQGVRFGRVVQEISATIADRRGALHMKVDVGAPLLRLVRVMHDGDEKPILHLTAFLASERSRILMDIPGETVNTLSAGRIVHDAPHASNGAG